MIIILTIVTAVAKVQSLQAATSNHNVSDRKDHYYLLPFENLRNAMYETFCKSIKSVDNIQLIKKFINRKHIRILDGYSDKWVFRVSLTTQLQFVRPFSLGPMILLADHS